MTLSTTGYTLGSNQPLTHARILYAPITGTITADGTDGDLAANEFTFQRWSAGTLPANWTLVTAADANVDTVFIAAHNLGTTGSTVTVQTASTVGGAFTTRATIVPTDNSAIAVMFNNAGSPYVIRELRIAVSGSDLEFRRAKPCDWVRQHLFRLNKLRERLTVPACPAIIHDLKRVLVVASLVFQPDDRTPAFFYVLDEL
jgi:hypothetical protein